MGQSPDSEQEMVPSIAPLDVSRLRHGTEPSRFAIAAIASGLVLGVALFVSLSALGLLSTLGIGLVLAVLMASIWILVQLARVRLLGAAVKVSERSLPELAGAIAFVRARVDYRKRVDVYVVAKQAAPLTLTSAFGTRLMLIEGDAVADLTQREGQPELKFLLATAFGRLKARHDRWDVALIAFEALDLLKFLNPFLNPWYRSTVYSGDQIGFACCADLDVSLSMAYRALAGKEIGPQIKKEGLIEQGVTVRRSKILRWSQLFGSSPHPTNRYLNLLAFAEATTPVASQAIRQQLDPAGQEAHRAGISAFPVRAPSDGPATAGLVIAGATILVALVAGLAVAAQAPTNGNDPGGTAVESPLPGLSEGGSSEPSDTETPPSTSSALATGVSGTALSALRSLIPPGVFERCEASPPPDATVLAALTCYPTGSDEVGWVDYYLADSAAAAASAFAALSAPIAADGTCGETWNLGGTEAGSLVCGTDAGGDPVVIWTVDNKAVLIRAQGLASAGSDVSHLMDWWNTAQWLDLNA